MTVNYLQPPLGYLLRLPCGDDAAGSPLDVPARDRAEQAAAFLRFERIGRIFSPDVCAARETAEIVWLNCSPDFTDCIYRGGLEEFLKFLFDEDRGLPCVLVSTQREIEVALASLDIFPANQPGDADAENVRSEARSNQQSAISQREIVAPGGVISVHAAEAGLIIRARHMIMDFSFTDLEKAVAWKELSPANAGAQ